MNHHEPPSPTRPLVNAHTHLELSDLQSLCPAQPVDLPRWLGHVSRHLHRRDATWFARASERGVRLLQEAGTTHVGDISWTGESVAPLARSGLQGIVWMELRGRSVPHARARMDDLERRMDGLRDTAAKGSIRIGVQVHAPYTFPPAMWEPALRWLERENLPLAIHTAESPAEWELFVHGRGPMVLYDTLLDLHGPPLPICLALAWMAARSRPLGRAIGCTYPFSRSGSPVAYLQHMGVLDRRPVLIHLVHVSDDDIGMIKRSGSTAVHCPRSNTLLRCGRMPLEKFLAAGVVVLLGTDSLASAPSLDIRDEVTAAVQLHKGVVDPRTIAQLAHAVGDFTTLSGA